MIAAQVGVSHPTVAKAREGLSTGNNLPVERTVGLDARSDPGPAQEPHGAIPGCHRPNVAQRSPVALLRMMAQVMKKLGGGQMF
jgi:hypothetical protein